ncbi:hypothetical protein CIT292_05902 [Citrobacter youngae ATCC 29220]|uniref:Uncharacterized protein n=1 Tax=Citrobacter youngae ATCC 29220 TaxID=500640 RepID=D4B6G6_9ENTR|nr:hypothetical protein CIT292_05902 [Citrobacter youngae ATCC 29220]
MFCRPDKRSASGNPVSSCRMRRSALFGLQRASVNPGAPPYSACKTPTLFLTDNLDSSLEHI